MTWLKLVRMAAGSVMAARVSEVVGQGPDLSG